MQACTEAGRMTQAGGVGGGMQQTGEADSGVMRASGGEKASHATKDRERPHHDAGLHGGTVLVRKNTVVATVTV